MPRLQQMKSLSRPGNAASMAWQTGSVACNTYSLLPFDSVHWVSGGKDREWVALLPALPCLPILLACSLLHIEYTPRVASHIR